MNKPVPEFLVTKDNYMDVLLQSKPKQIFHYKRCHSPTFNIKVIKRELRRRGFQLKFFGPWNEIQGVFRLKIVHVPPQYLEEEKIEQKTIFFDPVNLLA